MKYLVTCKIIELFVNTFTADSMYSLLNCANLTEPIQMQLSKKQKNVSDLFSVFFKSRLNFENFEKNMILIAYVLTTLRTPKDIVRQMSKKSLFRRPYEMQDGKRTQTLFKSAQQHLYYIC